MKVFSNSLEEKPQALARLESYRAAGALHAFGHVWYEGKGNVSGAMYHDHLFSGQIIQDCAQHAPRMHGIPVSMAYLIDHVFSGLSCAPDKAIHQLWPGRVYESMKPGTDLKHIVNSLVLHMLEKPEWLASYADEKGAHIVGLMHSIFVMRLHGIDQKDATTNFYHDHIRKRARYEMDGTRNRENYVYAALSAICGIDDNTKGALYYFIHNACAGSADKFRVPPWRRYGEISNLIVKMIEDSP